MNTQRRLIYMVGEPGAGKSTLLRAALAGTERYEQPKPFAHQLLAINGCVEAVELGRDRPMFPGTDTLSMSVIGKAEQFLDSPPAPLVIGEGARLGNARFLRTAREKGYEVTLVLVSSPQAEANRVARDGNRQNPGWIKSQTTKANNLVAGVPEGVVVTRIDTTDSNAVQNLRDLLAIPGMAKLATR